VSKRFDKNFFWIFFAKKPEVLTVARIPPPCIFHTPHNLNLVQQHGKIIFYPKKCWRSVLLVSF